MNQTLQTVHVGLGSRSYDILVGRGLLKHLGAETAACLDGKVDGRLAVIVSSPEITELYGGAR